MNIAINFILFIYLFFILAWLIFSFFNIFHAVKFGPATRTNKIALAVYICISALILIGSLIFISTVDWAHEIELMPLFL